MDVANTCPARAGFVSKNSRAHAPSAFVAAERRIESHQRLWLTIAADPDPAPGSKRLLEGLMCRNLDLT
jgi:hypothetical protein